MTVDWTNQSQGQFSKWENRDFGRKEGVQSRCMLTANLTHQQLSSQPGVGGNKQPLPISPLLSHSWQRCEKQQWKPQTTNWWKVFCVFKNICQRSFRENLQMPSFRFFMNVESLDSNSLEPKAKRARDKMGEECRGEENKAKRDLTLSSYELLIWVTKMYLQRLASA